MKKKKKTISEVYWGSGIGKCLETCHDPDRLPIGGGIHHLLWDTGIAGGAEETEADLLIRPTLTAGDPVYMFICLIYFVNYLLCNLNILFIYILLLFFFIM